MSELRQLAREDPDAVRSVAEKFDDTLRDRMLAILEEESGEDGSS